MIRPQRYEHDCPVDRLLEHPANANVGDEQAIDESMNELGFFGACLVQESTGFIIVGNHRKRIAQRRGEPTVPVLWVDVDDETAERMAIADNESRSKAVWNEPQLREQLERLVKSSRGLAGTGFTEAHLNDLRLLADNAKRPQPQRRTDKTDEELSREFWPMIPGFRVPPEVHAAWQETVDAHGGDMVAALASLTGVDYVP